MFLGFNLWGSLVVTVIVFFFGGLWYAKALFGGVYKNEMIAKGMEMKKEGSHGVLPFILLVILTFVAAASFSWVVGPNPSMAITLKTALAISIFWVATSLGTNYAFSGRSFKLFLIDAVYYVIQFLICGLVFVLWP